MSTRPPGIENPTTVEVGSEFLPVGLASSFFNNEAQDLFTRGVVGAGAAGGVTSASVALSCGDSATGGISAGMVVEGVGGGFPSERGVLDIEVREDIGEAGVVVSWTEGVAVVSVTGDGEFDERIWVVESSSNISVPLSRSGSSGTVTAAWTGVSGGVGILSASSITCGGGRARWEMIIAGATEGSVGLRDHTANSFFGFSADCAADSFITSGEVVMGDAGLDDGVDDTSGDWGMGSGSDVGSDTGSDTCSGAESYRGSAAGSTAGSRVGSRAGSGGGSGTESDICRTSWVEGPGFGVAVACEGKWLRLESCLGKGESGSTGQERW